MDLYRDLEKFRTRPLYIGPGTWKIPISLEFCAQLGLGKLKNDGRREKKRNIKKERNSGRERERERE